MKETYLAFVVMLLATLSCFTLTPRGLESIGRELSLEPGSMPWGPAVVGNTCDHACQLHAEIGTCTLPSGLVGAGLQVITGKPKTYKHDWLASQLCLVGRGCQAISRLMSMPRRSAVVSQLGRTHCLGGSRIQPGLGQTYVRCKRGCWPGLGTSYTTW